MKPALTTSGKTRTATAFDLHLAAAGFCATSCCRARRESVVKSSADAVRVLSNATVASNSPAAYFNFDVIFIYVLCVCFARWFSYTWREIDHLIASRRLYLSLLYVPGTGPGFGLDVG